MVFVLDSVSCATIKLSHLLMVYGLPWCVSNNSLGLVEIEFIDIYSNISEVSEQPPLQELQWSLISKIKCNENTDQLVHGIIK